MRPSSVVGGVLAVFVIAALASGCSEERSKPAPDPGSGQQVTGSARPKQEMPHSSMKRAEMPHGEMPHEEMGKSSIMVGHDGDPMEGKKIYRQLCASCHGTSGKGDGPVGQALNPKPSDFTKHMGNHGEDYFFKIIKQGGSAVGKSSAMPAWGGQLEDDDIWDVISYLKTFSEGH